MREHPGPWPTEEESTVLKIRQTRPRVMMSRTLDYEVPDNDPLSPAIREYADCEYRHYVHDAMVDSGHTLTLEEALRAGKAKFEELKAAGLPVDVFSHERVLPVRERAHAPIVYYMRMCDLVKIGTTTLIRSRFDAIHLQGVMAVEWGDREREKQRHRQFVDAHSHGEWFQLVPELVDHIFALRESFRGEQDESIDQWLQPRLPSVGRRPSGPGAQQWYSR